MTQALKSALQRAERLPRSAQDRIATLLMRQIEEAERQVHTPTWGASWQNVTPHERALDLERVTKSFPAGPGLPDEAVRRDAFYD